MAIFHLSIRPISRGKGHSAFAQIAYDTRSKLTDERTGQKHNFGRSTMCVGNRAFPMNEIDLIGIIPERGLHIRTRQESWLVSLPVELQSADLLKAIISGEVNCLSTPCVPFEPSSRPSKMSSDIPDLE